MSSGGTWTVPSELRPRFVTGAFTLITGITIVIGADVRSGAATLAGLGAKGTLVPTVDGMSWAAAGGSCDPALSACATMKAPTATMTRPTMRIVRMWMPWGLWLGSVYPPAVFPSRHKAILLAAGFTRRGRCDAGATGPAGRARRRRP